MRLGMRSPIVRSLTRRLPTLPIREPVLSVPMVGRLNKDDISGPHIQIVLAYSRAVLTTMRLSYLPLSYTFLSALLELQLRAVPRLAPPAGHRRRSDEGTQSPTDQDGSSAGDAVRTVVLHDASTSEAVDARYCYGFVV